MDESRILLVFLVFVCCSEHVRAYGCANLPSNQPAGPVINICEEHTTTVTGIMYFSGSSAEMGNMTRCNCSIVALTQEARLSTVASAVTVPQFTQCNATWRIQGSREETFTCQATHNFYIITNSSVVTIHVHRQILDDFDFCVYITRNGYNISLSYNITCENEATPDPTIATSSKISTATPNTASTTSTEISSSSTALMTSSHPSLPSSHISISTEEMTSQNETPSTPITSSTTSQTTGISGMSTSSDTATSSTAATEFVSQSSSETSVSSTTSASGFPVVPMAAGIGGGVLLLIIVIIVVICISCGRQRKRKESLRSQEIMTPRSHPNPNEYLQDNPLYESSSSFKKPNGSVNSDAAPNPADFMVDNILYESTPAIKANGTVASPDQSTPLTHSQEPISYAGREDSRPENGDHPVAEGLRQNPPLGKEKGTKMKARKVERPQNSPPAPPSATVVTASPESPPEGAAPGLNYASVDFSQGTAKASLRPREPPTEYTVIDLDATKKLSAVC